MATLMERAPEIEVESLDTASPGGLALFARQARDAARRSPTCVWVFPTRSIVDRPDLVLRLAVCRWMFQHGAVRLHLHEFRRLRRKLRYPITLALALATDRIVVSSASEAAAVRRAGFGWAARGREVRVVPPVNGTTPTDAEIDVVAGPSSADRRRTLGVFGMHRPDKGDQWLADILRRLDRRFDRVVVAGRGWEDVEWPPDLLARYEVVLRGHVERADLAAELAGWGLAVAPFTEGPHDGRLSLRTPLAFGVPTLTTATTSADRGDLTLAPSHLFRADAVALGTLPDLTPEQRRAGAREVATFEADVTRRLAEALFGPGP